MLVQNSNLSWNQFLFFQFSNLQLCTFVFFCFFAFYTNNQCKTPEMTDNAEQNNYITYSLLHYTNDIPSTAHSSTVQKVCYNVSNIALQEAIDKFAFSLRLFYPNNHMETFVYDLRDFLMSAELSEGTVTLDIPVPKLRLQRLQQRQSCFADQTLCEKLSKRTEELLQGPTVDNSDVVTLPFVINQKLWTALLFNSQQVHPLLIVQTKDSSSLQYTVKKLSGQSPNVAQMQCSFKLPLHEKKTTTTATTDSLDEKAIDEILQTVQDSLTKLNLFTSATSQVLFSDLTREWLKRKVTSKQNFAKSTIAIELAAQILEPKFAQVSTQQTTSLQ